MALIRETNCYLAKLHVMWAFQKTSRKAGENKSIFKSVSIQSKTDFEMLWNLWENYGEKYFHFICLIFTENKNQGPIILFFAT